MATNWLEVLRNQGEIAKRMARDVPQALDHPELTLDQASRLYGVVEKGAQDFDRIIGFMEDEDLDESFYEAADALESMWSHLSVAAANKVRTMQGLKPIEIPTGDDDDE